jgi:hypothetical protein
MLLEFELDISRRREFLGLARGLCGCLGCAVLQCCVSGSLGERRID